MTVDAFSALFAELGRLSGLDRIDAELRRRGYKRVAGVDEAGRGPLAGPVVAAAVILEENRTIRGLNDSKLLTAEERERLGVAEERTAKLRVGRVDRDSREAPKIGDPDRRRAVERARSRFATFAQAIKSTNPTAPRRIQSAGLARPETSS